MNETLSWLYEWNLIVWTNWIIFHDTHFASWNISTLFFRNKHSKVVKEKFHRISPPLSTYINSKTKHSSTYTFALRLQYFSDNKKNELFNQNQQKLFGVVPQWKLASTYNGINYFVLKNMHMSLWFYKKVDE